MNDNTNTTSWLPQSMNDWIGLIAIGAMLVCLFTYTTYPKALPWMDMSCQF